MINLAEGEKVLYEIRRHWYVLFMESFIVAVLFLVPWMIFFGLSTIDVSLLSGESAILFFFASLWLFVTWIVFMIIWTNYYLDVWLITDVRIIDIEQFSLFRRDMSEFRLDRIQDVTIEVKGLLPTLLHFGDVHVQTAGEMRRFTIKGVPDPYGLRDKLIKEHDRAVNESHGLDSHT